jgi:hypothetical protein
MAQFSDFPQSNTVLKPAAGTEDRVGELPAFKDDYQFVSSWVLSPAEIEEVLRTGRVWVFVLGVKHPPIHVSGTDPFAVAPPAPPA